MDSPRKAKLLSASQLKFQALNALSGNLAKFILAVLLMFIIKSSVQFILEVIVSSIYFLFVFTYEMLANSLTAEQLLLLLEDTSAMEPYINTLSLIDYFVTEVTAVFTNVFSVGITLYALNIACGYTTRVSDIFYGYRYQFGKSLKLSAILVVLQQLCSLPSALATYFLNTSTDLEPVIYMLALSLMGTLIYLPLYYGLSMSYFLMLDFPQYNVRQLLKLSRNLMVGHKFRIFLLELSFLPLLLLSLLTFGICYLWVYPYMQVACAFFFLNLMHSGATTQQTPTC